MGLTCYICQCVSETILSLITHIKVFHPFQAHSALKCLVANCIKICPSLRAFKRHLVKCYSQTSDSSHSMTLSLETTLKRNVVEHPNESDSLTFPINCETYENNILENLDITSYNFKKALMKSSLAFVSKLYASNTLNRTHVQEIVDSASEFLTSGYINLLKKKVFNILQNSNHTNEDLQELCLMFDDCENIFDGLQTDHQRLNAFKDSDCYVAPVSYIIGSFYRPRTKKNETIMNHELDVGQHVPMKEILKRFIELPGCLQTILSNLERLTKMDEPLTNVVQTEMWKKKVASHFQGKIVIPLFLFFDDMDPDNIAGSHAGDHKLGALYYTIACLPQEYMSKLENIFLACLFLSDAKIHGNNNLFQPIIQDLIDLEQNGLIITHNGRKEYIYFSMCLLLEDNLGIHSICGLSEGFNANYPCRMCKLHRSEMITTTVLDDKKSRTVQNYSDDVHIQTLAMTGIKEQCVWDAIPSFSFILSICFDIMHDLFEGVCSNDLALIIYNLVYVKKYLSLETLNNRIFYFDYGPTESGNAVPRINREHLLNGKLRFSATEMLCFVRYLRLMIGDLIPKEDDCWLLYVKLKLIVDIVTAPYVNIRSLNYLATLISEHHEMFLSAFPHMTLKPKYHYMLHYPQVMRNVGPLWFVCCLRWEAKHRPFKQAARATNSRRNLPLTLAIKHQLNICARFLSKRPLGNKFSFGVSEEVNVTDIENNIFFSHTLPPNMEKQITLFSWVRIFGTLFKKGMCVAVTYNEDNLPIFGQIEFVTYSKELNNVFFLLTMFHTIDYDEHLCSFEVHKKNVWLFICYDDLISYMPTYCRIGARSAATYITFRYTLL